jgi:hypothetical protein
LRRERLQGASGIAGAGRAQTSPRANERSRTRRCASGERHCQESTSQRPAGEAKLHEPILSDAKKLGRIIDPPW